MKKYKLFLIALLGIICAFALSFAVACSSGIDGVDGADGKDGTNGIGIVSVEKGSSSGLTDTYIITYSDGSTSTFVVTNGADGTNGTDGTTITSFTPAYDTDDTTVLSYTVKFSDGNEFTIYNGTNGNDGTIITSLTPTYDTDGTTVLSYTVIFSDGKEFTIYNGTNGKSAYQLYKETYGYTGTEAEWLYDLVNGNLAEKQTNTHTVTFNYNDDATESYSISVEHGYAVTRPEDPERNCYTFDGWYYGDEKWSFISNYVMSDITLTAKWTMLATDGVIYEFDSDTSGYAATGYTGTETKIYIAAVYDDLPVTTIGGSAFQDNSTITSIYIPDSVTRINNYSFYNCSALTAVYFGSNSKLETIESYAFSRTALISFIIPDGVTSIDSVFVSCSSLKSITIGKGVTSIGDYPFSACTSLTSFIVDSENTTYKSVDGNLYSYDGKELVRYAIGKTATSFTIGDGVTSIDTSAFNGCTSLETITLPATLNTLGSTVFSDTIVDEVYYNGDLSDWLNTTYGSGSSNPLFNGAQLYFTDNNGGYELVESVNITGVTAINSSAFYGCTSLISVTMGDSVTSIGSHAFRNCTSLTSVTIGGNVTSMGSNVFNNCSSLASITILVSVISIGSCSFEGCTLLKEVYYTGTASQWASMVFNDEYASPLFYGADLYLNGVIAKDITIEGITTVNAYTFRGSTITSVTIDGNNTNIASQAFFASSLISVVISDNVKLIGHYVFTYCTSLTSIVIGSNVTYIGSNVFDDCSSLTSIYYNGTSSAYSSIDIYSTVPSSATIYFYAEEDSITAVGNYWYYDTDNNIVTWTVKDTSTEGGTASE